MARSPNHRLIAALAASAAGAALAAAPALATEGPLAPPPASQLPLGMAPVGFGAPAAVFPPATAKRKRVIQRARLVPRRVRRGQRARLVVRLAQSSRLRIVVSRGTRHGRVRASALSVPARGRRVSLRLPARSRGHALRPGRYRVRVFAVDAQGTRSRPVDVTLRVRRARR